MKYNIEVELDKERVDDLIVNFFEGGNYWADWDTTPIIKDFKWDSGNYAMQILNGEVEVNMYDIENSTELLGRLNTHTIKTGLDLMSKNYPNHFADVINENDDASTADIFMQCCIIGEVIYG